MQQGDMVAFGPMLLLGMYHDGVAEFTREKQ
jgi:hypothetical protein